MKNTEYDFQVKKIIGGEQRNAEAEAEADNENEEEANEIYQTELVQLFPEEDEVLRNGTFVIFLYN